MANKNYTKIINQLLFCNLLFFPNLITMKKLFVILFLLISRALFSQDVSINNGWKFKTGDSAAYASVKFNDNDWAPIKIGQPWETQGYEKYDGFAWYRNRIVIPSSLLEKSFLKEKIRFDLGKIDDGDEVYLNGSLIGRNAGRNIDIRSGPYDVQRSYTLSLNDARILWDRENVIAVRVFDHGGDGGMYDGKYGVSVMDVTDYISLNTVIIIFGSLVISRFQKKSYWSPPAINMILMASYALLSQIL
jgi:alpha-galactosidase